MPKLMTAIPLLLVLLGPSFFAEAAEAPSVENLVAALMAQEQRIASFSCSWNEVRSEVDSSGTETKVAEYDKLIRWTREAAYAQQDEVHFDHALGKLLRGFYTDRKAAADSSQWSKAYATREISIDFGRHGKITPPELTNLWAPFERSADFLAHSMVHRMYDYIQTDYVKHFLNGNAEVIIRDDGYIELKSAPSETGRILMYTLDPNKGFAPVSTALFEPEKGNDALLCREQCTFSDHIDFQ